MLSAALVTWGRAKGGLRGMLKIRTSWHGGRGKRVWGWLQCGNPSGPSNAACKSQRANSWLLRGTQDSQALPQTQAVGSFLKREASSLRNAPFWVLRSLSALEGLVVPVGLPLSLYLSLNLCLPVSVFTSSSVHTL